MHIVIEWDSKKAASNLKKHGVSFEEAATALLDPLARAREDPDAEGEPRWILLGMRTKQSLISLVYTLRVEDRIRLIEARPATRTEAKDYA